MQAYGVMDTEQLFWRMERVFQRQMTDFLYQHTEAAFCSFRNTTSPANTELLERIIGVLTLSGFQLCLLFEPRNPRLRTGILRLQLRFGLREDAVSYPVYTVLAQLAPTDFTCYTISDITTEEQLAQSVRYLLEHIMRHYDALYALAMDPIRLQKLEQAFREEMEIYFQQGISEKQLSAAAGRYSDALTARLSEAPYTQLLMGQIDTACRAYRSKSRTRRQTTYERNLYAYVQDTRAEALLPRELCFFLPEKEEKSTEQARMRAVGLGFVLTYAAICAAVLAIFSLSCRLFQRDYVYVLFPGHTGLLLFALLPALLLVLLRRHDAYRLFAKRKLEALLDLDPMTSAGLRVWGARLLIAVCILTPPFYANHYVAFGTTGLSDCREVGRTTGIHMAYDHITVSQTDGDCTLYLSDGTTLRLNLLASDAEIQNDILPILQQAKE